MAKHTALAQVRPVSFRTLVLIGVSAVFGAAVSGAAVSGAAVSGAAISSAVLTPSLLRNHNNMSHDTHAVGRASSQQRSPYSKARPSVLGVACPPQWMPMFLAEAVLQPPHMPPPPPLSPTHMALPPSHYTFAHGTFQPPSTGSAHLCTDLDNLLNDTHLAEAIDMCFDANFSCAHAIPFVGMARIVGMMHTSMSNGSSQSKAETTIQFEGSDIWLPALVPVHFPRGSRVTTQHPVPVVGCLVDGNRFVLSWADIRCRSSTADASFPAECDGADQRNVAVENATEAISFVNSLTPGSRRKLGVTVNNHITGKKTAVIVLISPSDATNALESWLYGGYGRDNDYNQSDPASFVDNVVSPQPDNRDALMRFTCASCAPHRCRKSTKK